ncbi:MAG TPA: DUF6489 family protein [Kiloniellaceae bacterium]|nr:DUF6489 family protein [Kiloniellaceae bacterium]
MKITIEVDCTPEEARDFLGLPNVAAMQQDLVAEVQKRLTANIAAMEPEQLLKTWLPASLQGLEQIQRAFWSQMSQPTKAGKATGKKPSGGSDT